MRSRAEASTIMPSSDDSSSRWYSVARRRKTSPGSDSDARTPMSVLPRKSRLAKRASRSDTNAPPPAEPQGRRVNAAPTSTTRPSAVIAPVRRLPPSPPMRPAPSTISISRATPISRANGVIGPSGRIAGARLSRASGEESQEDGSQAALDGGERERREHPEEDQDKREERERDPL